MSEQQMRADLQKIIFEDRHHGSFQIAADQTISDIFRCVRDAVLDPEMPAAEYDLIEAALDRAGITKGIVGR